MEKVGDSAKGEEAKKDSEILFIDGANGEKDVQINFFKSCTLTSRFLTYIFELDNFSRDI